MKAEKAVWGTMVRQKAAKVSRQNKTKKSKGAKEQKRQERQKILRIAAEVPIFLPGSIPSVLPLSRSRG